MMRWTLGCAFGLVVVSANVLVGQVRPHDPEWTAPAKHAARANPLAATEQIVGGGRKVFLERCAQCHGDDGRGTERAPDLAGPDVLAQTDGALFWKISTGNSRSGMPALSFLPREQRWQLVLFLRTLGK